MWTEIAVDTTYSGPGVPAMPQRRGLPTILPDNQSLDIRFENPYFSITYYTHAKLAYVAPPLDRGSTPLTSILKPAPGAGFSHFRGGNVVQV